MRWRLLLSLVLAIGSPSVAYAGEPTDFVAACARDSAAAAPIAGLTERDPADGPQFWAMLGGRLRLWASPPIGNTGKSERYVGLVEQPGGQRGWLCWTVDQRWSTAAVMRELEAAYPVQGEVSVKDDLFGHHSTWSAVADGQTIAISVSNYGFGTDSPAGVDVFVGQPEKGAP
jgi:hypothetical protein